MDEAEWLACGEFREIVTVAVEKATVGRRRAFIASCVERVRHLLNDQNGRLADDYLRWIWDEGPELSALHPPPPDWFPLSHPIPNLASLANENFELTVWATDGFDCCGALLGAEIWERDAAFRKALPPVTEVEVAAVRLGVRGEQIRRTRDVFGNPFRPVTADPAWLTPTATALARRMHESRDFSALPILADALQDAGCDHPDVLAHCHSDGPHTRGCWVVDLVLGRE